MLPLLSRQTYQLPYYHRLLRLFGPYIIAYWPLWEPSGTVAKDISRGRNGTYSAVTLGQPGVGDGRTSASFDGTNSRCDAFSAGLGTAFSFAEGSLHINAAVGNAWTETTTRRMISFTGATTNDKIALYRTTNTQTIRVAYTLNATAKTLSGSFGGTGFMDLWFTWSRSNNRARLYQMGRLVASDTYAVDAASGLAATAIGGFNPDPRWNGKLAHVLVLSREASANEIQSATRSGVMLSLLGDSVTDDGTSGGVKWWGTVLDKWPTHGVINHATTGHSIITNMDAQASAAATDNANFIILALGLNDNNSGDMEALQAKVESNIVALKASNPNATLYYLNVLPCWVNNTTGAEVDKSNIRTAIAAACTAQGITCWDTYTTPWITQAQTSDGTHPTAAGHAAIAAQVLARL